MATEPSSPTRAAHLRHWPPLVPRHLTVPQTNVFYNAEVSAARYPDKPYIIFYDTAVSFAEFKDAAERIAGFLQHRCGVKAGDRVLLYMQNSPQWVLAFYGILRANAVVVPVNPMNRVDELRHYVEDCRATTAFVAQELLPQIQPLLRSEGGEGLEQLVVATYSDYIKHPTDLPVPDFVAAPAEVLRLPGLVSWADVLAHELRPGPLTAGADDPCAMPYTSGTTGAPKGCVHTHRSVMSTLVGGTVWFTRNQDAVFLSALPFFHVTGMSGSMNGPMYAGATIVVLPRWDRETAAACIQRYGVTTWQTITAMLVDFLAQPGLSAYDLSSLQVIRGGGAAMPEAVARRMEELLGLTYVEGYGMSETMAATHINPPHRPKPQCLGIPVFDVDARIVDPDTFRELPPGESGEIVVHGPQVMQGYWNNPEATAAGFIEIDGRRFLRTGDLAFVDEDGYFFMTDRLKRMINASGYKVWPAEVEALMYRHPAIQEACVIASADARRGETVKALVVLKPGHEVTEQQIIDWSREHMAAYKSPRIVQFVPSLPQSGSGKVMWRELQEAENSARSGGSPTAPPSTADRQDLPAFADMGSLIRLHARQAPERRALVEGDRSLDYGLLDVRMDRIAAALQREGVAPGEVIAICGASSIEYACIFLGALRAGVVVAPLAPGAMPASLQRMLADADAKLLFMDRGVNVGEGGPPRVAMDGSTAGRAFEEWLAGSAAPRPVTIAPDAGFNIIYSSGTTGEPKGIVQSHAMRWAYAARAARFGYGADTVTLLSTPLYSNTTLVVFFPTLSFGGTVLLMPKFDARAYLELAERHRVTHSMLVPVQYERLLALPEFDRYDLTSFRYKFSTSAPFAASLKAEVLRRWPGGLVEFYGMTEGGGSCILEAHLHPDKLHTVGTPAQGHVIRLIDENGREVGPGEAGEVVGHSPGMMIGYHRRADATREAEWFDATGKRFIRTGDVGRFDADGYLTLLDRRKDVIISGGFNIYPSDLEAVLREHPAVAEVAVVGVASRQWGETPVAFVVRRPGHGDVEDATLLRWANERLGKTQRLLSLRSIESLPRSPIGKVLKRDLRELHEAG